MTSGETLASVRGPKLVIDTSVLLAATDTSAPEHRACAVLLESFEGTLVLPALVIAEAAWMNSRDFSVVRPNHAAGFVLLPDGIARFVTGETPTRPHLPCSRPAGRSAELAQATPAEQACYP